MFILIIHVEGSLSSSVETQLNVKKKIKQEKVFPEFIVDGFDFPVGNKDGKGKYTCIADQKEYNGWYIAVDFGKIYHSEKWIHTGEDWNGVGGGNTDLEQPVYSTAAGKVLFAKDAGELWGHCILIEHTYIENGKIMTVFSQYSHLHETMVKKGDMVKRRQQIGTIGQDPDKIYYAHLHFEIRKENMREYPVTYWPSSNDKSLKWVKSHYEDPSDFINSHRKLFNPFTEKKLVIVKKDKYKLYIIEKGKPKKFYEIALSQDPIGGKTKLGDLKIPIGEYKICRKAKGPFDKNKWWHIYLGPRWIHINYPNKYDAQIGLDNKIIKKSEYKKIINALNKNSIPPQNTKLGGGIGIHGWTKADWKKNDRNLTWGCISMHNKDIIEFYDWIDINTKIIIIE